MRVKFKRYLALIAVLLLTGCPPHQKDYYLVATDYQIEDMVISASDSSFWMFHKDLGNLRFRFDLDLNNVYKTYWLEVEFEYESDLNQSVYLIPDSISLASTLFNYKFDYLESYEHIRVVKKSWEGFVGTASLNMIVLRFMAFPKDRKKVNGDTLIVSGVQIRIGDSAYSELPELKFVMNETKSSFLGKRRK